MHQPPDIARRLPRQLLLGLLVFAIFGSMEHTFAAPDSSSEDEVETVGILAPTLGRPLFIAPGGKLQIVARLDHPAESTTFNLLNSELTRVRYPLKTGPGVRANLAQGATQTLIVPADVPPRTYDLEICSGERTLISRHCIAIGNFDRAIRVVHLSNMNLGDVCAPRFDQRLIDEVNLLAPTLIVATGDLLDATCSAPDAGWHDLLEQLTRFEAPLAIACGDHDNIDLYCRYVAPSPIGLIHVGRQRGLILLDHPRVPIGNNPEQIRWVERTLGTPGFDGLTFIVTHDDSPNLLSYWQQQGTLTRMLRAGRIGLWFAAGHTDWDGRAYRALIDAAAPLVFLKTHESSTALQGGSTGLSHYRVVDIIDNCVNLPGETKSAQLPVSTPVGYLSAALNVPNDGTRSRIQITATNNLPYRLDGLGLSVYLRKSAGQRPWCHGARLVQVSEFDTYWMCRVAFDLPEKGSLRALVGSVLEPRQAECSVSYEVDRMLHFKRFNTATGLSFLQLVGPAPTIHITSHGPTPLTVAPLVRLDGDLLAYRPLEGQAPFATAYRPRIKPGETISLRLDLSAVRVAPGRRELQVYLEGLDAVVPYCQPIEVVIDN